MCVGMYCSGVPICVFSCVTGSQSIYSTALRNTLLCLHQSKAHIMRTRRAAAAHSNGHRANYWGGRVGLGARRRSANGGPAGIAHLPPWGVGKRSGHARRL